MSETYVALVQACSSGDLEKVKSVVLKRPKPPKDNLQSGLLYAVSNAHDTVVKFLLEHGAKVDESATIGARSCRSTAVFQVLLDHGWDINSSAYLYKPTLWGVVEDEELTRWFLEHGADPSLNGDGESSPLDSAASRGTPSIISQLLEHGAKLNDSNALQFATSGPLGIPMMAFILECGFDINAFDVSRIPPGRRTRIGTALHIAVKYGHKDRVQFLLDRGADRNIRHPYKVKNMSPLEWAQWHRKTEIYELLSG